MKITRPCNKCKKNFKAKLYKKRSGKRRKYCDECVKNKVWWKYPVKDLRNYWNKLTEES